MLFSSNHDNCTTLFAFYDNGMSETRFSNNNCMVGCMSSISLTGFAGRTRRSSLFVCRHLVSFSKRQLPVLMTKFSLRMRHTDHTLQG